MAAIAVVGFGLMVSIWALRAHAANVSGRSDFNITLKGTADPQSKKLENEVSEVLGRKTRDQSLTLPRPHLVDPESIPRSFVDIGEEGNNLVLHAKFPDNDTSEVEVKVDSERKLHLTISRQKHRWKWDHWMPARVTETNRFDDALHLQDDVDPTGMKVERKAHEITVTIPKVGDGFPKSDRVGHQ